MPEFVKFVQSQPILIQNQESDASRVNKIDLSRINYSLLKSSLELNGKFSVDDWTQQELKDFVDDFTSKAQPVPNSTFKFDFSESLLDQP